MSKMKQSSRWITPKAQAFDSGIDRVGVVAVENISKGEEVGVLGGMIVPKKEIDSYWKQEDHVGIQIDDNFFIVPPTRKEVTSQGIFNHSCDPNCGFSTSITLVALQDIEKGEELVFDYAFCETYMEAFTCNCKSENCRKVVKPTDWKITALQKRYKDYFSPYIKNKIN